MGLICIEIVGISIKAL